jgi:hypothetical protein
MAVLAERSQHLSVVTKNANHRTMERAHIDIPVRIGSQPIFPIYVWIWGREVWVPEILSRSVLEGKTSSSLR